MRLGIFTDPHYSSQEVTCGVRRNSASLRKIREAYRFFEREGCDLAVCLGDLTDKEADHAAETENLKRIAEVMGAAALPTVCLMGNHDAFAFTAEEFYGVLGERARPADRAVNGGRLVFLDACYFADGARYLPGDTDWTDTYFPFEAALRETLRAARGDVYAFVHQNLDPTVGKRHLIANAESVNALLAGCGRVKAVYQGHYHPGCRSVINGIRYVAFPAMCENEGAYFIEEV